jgi:hypothetical protein
MSIDNWLFLAGLIITVFIALIGCYVFIRVSLASLYARIANVEKDYLQLRNELNLHIEHNVTEFKDFARDNKEDHKEIFKKFDTLIETLLLNKK